MSTARIIVRSSLRRIIALVGGLVALVPLVSSGGAQATGYALRFYGHGVMDIDSVKIRIDAPARPADVASDFTLEWWMKAKLGENGASACTTGGDNWIAGNIMFDRDIFGSGDFGDYGVSLRGGRIAFGVDVGGNGNGICGASSVADGVWHHVALTRDSSAGTLRIFVDGQLNGSGSGPPGDMSYRNGRSTAYPNSDPFLMIGEEKHFGPSAYSGWIDEVRLSTTVRYSATFTPPLVPFVPDAQTATLYHFDEGPAGACSGTVLDSSGASGGPSTGMCQYGGTSPGGPVYSSDTPFRGPPPATVTPSITATLTPSRTATSVPQPTATSSPTPTRTASRTVTVTSTPSKTPTPPRTPSPTPTPTVTQIEATQTATLTTTAVPTSVSTATPTVPASTTSTPTASPTLTAAPVETPTFAPSATATTAVTPTGTRSGTATPTESQAPTVTPSALLTQTPTFSATSSPTLTAPRTATATATPTNGVLRGDLNGDGRIRSDDLALLIVALFEAAPPSAADVNGDARVTSADTPALIQRLGDE